MTSLAYKNFTVFLLPEPDFKCSHTCAVTATAQETVTRWFSLTAYSYRQPPTPKDGNCLFHTISDQLKCMGKHPQTASQLRIDVVSFLKSNPTTPDGIQFREFVNHGGWETYLRRMSMDGEWGDYIALVTRPGKHAWYSGCCGVQLRRRRPAHNLSK